MTEKHLKFQEWVKQLKFEWTHLPILKGKQAERNLFILKTLMETPAPGLSTWDLALEWLKETMGAKFNSTPGDTIHHKRMTENAAMNRSLRHLEKKEYVEKLGSIYQLTLKSVYMVFIWEPSLYNTSKMWSWTIQFKEEKVPFVTSTLKNMDDFEKPMLTELGITSLKTIFSDDTARGIASAGLKHVLISWRANVDDISNADFAVKIFGEFNRIAEKFSKKR